MTFNFMDVLTGFIDLIFSGRPSHCSRPPIQRPLRSCNGNVASNPSQPTMGMEKNKARVRDEPGLFVWRVPILRQTSEPKR